MKTIEDVIVLHDPGISSYNIGDEIISDSIKYEMRDLFDKNTTLGVSTHLPLSWRYLRTIRDTMYQFVCGSNLLKSSFMGIKRQWDIRFIDKLYVKDCILIGVGSWQYGNKFNLYTRFLYKSLLSKSHMHSVRDEYTKQQLNEIGMVNVINTACPTMWRFNADFCCGIQTQKSEKVVFTLTDYNPDEKRDSQMIECLLRSYNEVYFFPQGGGDNKYLEKLGYFDKVKHLRPNLKSYDEFLSNNNVEHVGTRLHGGIRALQHKRRALIIAVDNRALELNANFNIPIVKREEIEKLKDVIDNPMEVKIQIPEKEIKRWKEQFFEK